MKKTTKTDLKMFLISIFISVIITISTTQATIPPLGQIANDGTRVILYYWDPFEAIRGPNKTYEYDGAMLPVLDSSLIEYQTIYICFVFAGPVYKNLTYTIYYSYERANATTEEIYYVPLANETRKVNIIGLTEYADEVELPVHKKEVYVRIVYRDIELIFYHLTSDAAQPKTVSGYEQKMSILKQAFISFGVIVCIGGILAAAISLKAGIFYLDWSWAILLPLLAFDLFLIFAEYIYYINIKEAVYRFPTWAVYFFLTVTTTIILVNIFNKIKGEKYYRCAIYDTKGISVNSHLIPLDKDEKNILERGFKASCIRLFGSKRYDNSFLIGRIVDEEYEESITIKSDQKIDKKESQFKKKGFTLKSKDVNVDGTITLTFVKKKKEFKETNIVAQWFWNPVSTSNYLREYWCKDIIYERSTIKKASWVWGVGGGLALFNFLFNFFTQQKSAALEGFLKVFLWVIWGAFILWATNHTSSPGCYKIEVLDPHIAMSIVEAQINTAKAEEDALTILELKKRIQNLHQKFAIDLLDEAHVEAKGMFLEVMSRVPWKKMKEEEEKKDA